MKSLIPIICIVFLACKNPNTPHTQKVPEIKKLVYHLIDSAGLVFPDTSTFYKLNCGLYRNKAGIIGYQAIDKSMEKPEVVYLVSVYYEDLKDTMNGGIMDMNKVVDTTSFEIAGYCYFTDKNHVYNFHRMMDGGTISINWDADKNSFTSLGIGIYGKDWRHCFYRGEIVKSADSKSFNVFKYPFNKSAFDKRHFYGGSEVMTAKEVKESGFDTLKINR